MSQLSHVLQDIGAEAVHNPASSRHEWDRQKHAGQPSGQQNGHHDCGLHGLYSTHVAQLLSPGG